MTDIDKILKSTLNHPSVPILYLVPLFCTADNDSSKRLEPKKKKTPKS